MDTTFLEDLTFEELKALIDACQVEINDRKEELKTNLMDEFEAWLKKVHNAGFEVLDSDGVVITYWDVNIVDEE